MRLRARGRMNCMAALTSSCATARSTPKTFLMIVPEKSRPLGATSLVERSEGPFRRNAHSFLLITKAYHTPNGPAIGNGDTAQYTFAGQQIVNENFVTARADHKFSNNDSLFGTYMFDRTPYASPDGLNNVEFTTLTARQFAALEETHIFSPGFVNSIRLGGNHETVNNN